MGFDLHMALAHHGHYRFEHRLGSFKTKKTCP